MDRFYQLLVTMEMTPPNGCGLYVDGCVSVLVGRMSEDRLALVRQVNYSNLPLVYSPYTPCYNCRRSTVV